MNIRLRIAVLGATALLVATGITVAGLGASALAAPAFAGSGQAAGGVRVSVAGIDRAGKSVRVTAFADAGQGPPIRLSDMPRSIHAGQYWIGATVTTPAERQ